MLQPIAGVLASAAVQQSIDESDPLGRNPDVNKLDALFDALPTRLLVVDANGTLIAANAAAIEEIGKPREDLIGTCLWDLMPPNRASHLRLLFKQVLGSGAPVCLVQRTGERWNEVTLLPLLEDPSPAIAICSQDITRQVVAEENAKLLTLKLVQAQEDERRRISQDLHDDIGHRMTALLLQLRSIERDLAAGRMNIHGQVRDAIRTVQATMRQVRQVFYHLRPPSLDTVPLPCALDGFCQAFAQQTGLHVDFSSEECLPFVPDQHATALYRLVQEALNNIVKHSNATSAWVNLDFCEGEISLSIEDNGEGFDPQRCVWGMGLSGVRDRLSLLGGTLEVETAPGRGTRLLGSLPLIAQVGY